MAKTIKLTESELVQLIEDISRKQILENAKSKDVNFDTKVNKISNRLKRVTNRLTESTDDEKLTVLQTEIFKLKQQGYSYLIIGESFKKSTTTLNEGMLDWLGSAFGGAGEVGKEWVIKHILGFFGLKDGKLKKGIAAAMANVDLVDMPKLMTDCSFTSEIVAEGLVEYIMVLVSDDISMELTSEEGGGLFTDLVRNTMAERFETTETFRSFSEGVSSMICDGNNELRSLEDITQDVMSGDVGVAGSTDDKYSDIMSKIFNK